MATVLAIDDDRAVLRLIQSALEEQPDVRVLTAATAEEGFATLHHERPDVLLLDVMLPDGSGREAFHKVKDIDDKLPVIFITVDDASSHMIESMKVGAFDYLIKPLEVQRIRDVVRQALEVRLMRAPVHMQGQGSAEENGGDLLIGRSPSMQEVYKAIGRVAPQDVSVLIRGESGTGKELVARAIYQHSHRAEGPFLAVNCAALTESLLESELFGHEKGSFTGATSQRIGKFEQCSGGTLFMDEVGDMSPLMQSKVLRVLQEQQFERVGGMQTIRTDVRIIAATNRDLEEMVAQGKFREDLYYRLNGFTIKLPSLRDRKDDILLLLDWFFARFRRELNKDVHGISPDALGLLMSYSWPGNVRQLQSVLKQALVQSTGPVLISDFFPDEIRNPSSDVGKGDGSSDSQSDLSAYIEHRLQAGTHNLYAEILEAMERVLITAVLKSTHGNQSKAADILGITRGSLRNKVRALGIYIDRMVGVEGPATPETVGSDA